MAGFNPEILVFFAALLLAGLLIFWKVRREKQDVNDTKEEKVDPFRDPPVDLDTLYPEVKPETVFFTVQMLRLKQSPEIALEFIEKVEDLMDTSEDPRGDFRFQVEKSTTLLELFKKHPERNEFFERSFELIRTLQKHPFLEKGGHDRIYARSLMNKMKVERVMAKERRRFHDIIYS